MSDQANEAKIETLFHRTHDLPTDQREEFLSKMEQLEPTEVITEVRELVAASQAFEESSTIRKPIGFHELFGPEELGTIGPYSIIEEIGAGGMGTVYLAQQEEPFREVALKIIKHEIPSQEFIARFEAERQAMATMKSSNIVQLYEVGKTDDDQPYYVMEYVSGEEFNVYCDSLKLSIKARLELFLQLCAAVQHAHQKGIIHRDLKPQNILVTSDDEPVVKVIDFGLAKAVGNQGNLSSHPAVTQRGRFVGTPKYASPEQVAGKDIDTRTDIYSLGVILFELLTGSTPHEKSDDLLEAIKKDPPARPSQQLSKDPQSTTTISEQRKISPQKLTQLLKGELDWVVMKALEKERRRRYETVSALADDIRRFLNQEPVVARPPSVSYRISKAIKRNKTAAVAAVLVLASLVGGIVTTSRQAYRARQAERKEAEAREKEVEARIVAENNYDSALDAADKWLEIVRDLRDVSGQSQVRDDLMRSAIELYKQLSGNESRQAETELRRAKVYLKLAELERETEQYEAAMNSLDEASTLLNNLKSDTQVSPQDIDLNLGRCTIQRAKTLEKLGRLDESLTTYEAARSQLQPIKALAAKELGDIEAHLAYLYSQNADFGEAEIACVNALAEYQVAAQSYSLGLTREISQVQQLLSYTNCRTGNWQFGVSNIKSLVEENQELEYRDGGIFVADARLLLADLYARCCEPKLALEQIDAAVSVYEDQNQEYLTEFHRLVEAKLFQGRLLMLLARPLEAEAAIISILRKCRTRYRAASHDFTAAEQFALSVEALATSRLLIGKTTDIENVLNGADRFFEERARRSGDDLMNRSLAKRLIISLSLLGRMYESNDEFVPAMQAYNDALHEKANLASMGNLDEQEIDLLAQIQMHIARASKKSEADSLPSCREAFKNWGGLAIIKKAAPATLNRYARALLHAPAVEARDAIKALTTIERALAAWPASCILQETRAAALCDLKEFEKAVTALDKADKSGPGPTIYSLAIRSRCLHRSGELEAARAKFSEAQEAFENRIPGHLDQQQLLSEIRDEIGE